MMQAGRKVSPSSGSALWALLIALIAVVVVSGYARAEQKLRVGKAISEAFSFVPLDVGIENGIFKKHGLEIQEFDFSGSAKLQQALAANSIDIGLGSGPELAFIAKGVPALGVAALADAPLLLTLSVEKSSSIKTIADLKGKKVSVSTVGSLTEWLVHELSRQQGWGTDGIQTVAIGDDAAQVSALRTHQVDGIVTDVAAAYRLQDAGNTRILVRFGGIVKDFHIHIIYARKSLINSDPDAVRAFLAGWFETVAYMRQHKDKTVEISARVMGVSPAIASRVYDEMMPAFNPNGRFNPKALDVLKRSFVEMGILPTQPDMSKLVTEKFLPARSAKDQ